MTMETFVLSFFQSMTKAHERAMIVELIQDS